MNPSTTQQKNNQIKNSVIKNLFTAPSMARMAMMIALVIVLGQVSIPLPFSPVPITGQTLAIILVGLLMTPMQTLVVVGLWIVMGTLGLPVFSLGRSGPEVLLGTSGGYIIGFLLCAIFIAFFKMPLTGYKSVPRFKSLMRNSIVVGIGSFVIIYTLGVLGLMRVTEMPLGVAIAKGAVPFLLGDAIKLIIAVLACDQLLRTAPQMFTTANNA